MTGRTRRGNLESSISETPNAAGYYEAKVWMGVRGDGRPDRRHLQRKSLPALRRAVRDLERKRDAGRIARSGRAPTVEQLMEDHLRTVLPAAGRAPTTIASYRSLCRNEIYPRWGAQRVDRLLPEHITEGLADMLERGLARATVRKVHAVLSSALNHAVRNEVITRNPAATITAPAPPRPEMPHLSLPQAQRFRAAAAPFPNAARWALALGTGLRQGEALGLRWEFLDLERGEMRVWWQLQRLTWAHGCALRHPDVLRAPNRVERDAVRARLEHRCAQGHCKRKPCPRKCQRHKRACPPPCPADCTAHARLCPQRRDGGLVLREVKEHRHKTVPLEPWWCDLLRKHRDEQYVQRLTAGEEWQDRDFVFCQWNGNPIDPRRDYAEWRTVLKLAGLPAYRLHAARHSAASMMLAEGVAASVVQKILGHSDIRVTERYLHVTESLSRDASSRMSAALRLPGEEVK